MKMYKVRDIVEMLLELQDIGIDGYCGFGFSERDNLVIVLKNRAPEVAEAVQEVEVLRDEGEY